MAKNYDELVDFRHGSDSGEDTLESVQPVEENETIWADADGRPIENLRARTQILKQAIETTNFFTDYDRALVLRADGPLTLTQPASGAYALTLASSGSLWVYPALSPGRISGGRKYGGRVFCANSAASGAWTPYSGTEGVDDLILVADRRYTGQRGYADTDDFATTPAGRSLGANRIEVTLVASSGIAGGTAGIVAVIEGSPVTKIRITYGTSGTPTTLAQLISFINGDRSSQGTYGVADFLRASTTGTTTNPPVPFTNGLVQGAYDAEAHEVTKAQLDAFFDAVDGAGAYVNRMSEGEGLAIAYPLGPVERGVSAPKGGRRQSLWDLPTNRAGTYAQNTTPSAGWSLFVTGREPEKIPGAIPIGKLLDGEFVFIDGTRIAPDESLELGQSRTSQALLAATTTSSDGARLVGYEGGAAWSADTTPPSYATLPASTVSAVVSRIANTLCTTTTGQGGSRRVGGEAQTGSPSLGNAYFLSLTAGSLREQLVQLLQGTDGGGRTVGLNGRVSEYGHRMQGAAPLRKEFGATGMPSSGGEFLRAELHRPTNAVAAATGHVHEKAFLMLSPLVYSVSSTDNLLAAETGSVAGATTLTMTSMTSGSRFANVWARLPLLHDGVANAPVPLVYARLTNLPGAADAPEGFYVVYGGNTSTSVVTFRKLDGSNPNFTGGGSAVSVEFFTAFELGADQRGTKLRWAHVGGDNILFDSAGNPAAVIAVSGVNVPLLKVFTPNPSTNEGTLQCVMWADRMEWGGGRKTTNILRDDDKELLDGNESGTTVDATNNHHHAGEYTRTVMYAAADFVDLDDATSLDEATVDTKSPRSVSGPAATDEERVAVILDVLLVGRSVSSITQGARFSFGVSFWESNAAAKAHATVEIDVPMVAAPGTALVWSARQQITVPVAADTFYLSLVSKANVSLVSNSMLLTVKEIGAVLARTDRNV